MTAPRFFRRPLFFVSAGLFLLVAGWITYRVLRPTSYQRYERINVGATFADVTRLIGHPTDSHSTTNGTDYLFVVTGHPDYPKLMGVSFPVHRIVRVQGGRVISKGPYENYYDPYSPGWSPKKN